MGPLNTEEQGGMCVNRPGKPCYRRGILWQKQIIHCLRLMNQHRAGEPLEPEQRQLAQRLEVQLTPLQVTYLRMYYANVLTIEQIARLLGRNISSVSRGLTRAETNVEKVIGAAGC